jgi:hypothetical protein
MELMKERWKAEQGQDGHRDDARVSHDLPHDTFAA